jgi:hypothetical protein
LTFPSDVGCLFISTTRISFFVTFSKHCHFHRHRRGGLFSAGFPTGSTTAHSCLQAPLVQSLLLRDHLEACA